METGILRAPSGQLIEVTKLKQTGFGARDHVYWEMTSDAPITREDAAAIVERNFPSAGYGESTIHRAADNRLVVTSWASAG